ncbi:sensor histidine kinase [Zooshikella marina]|uniref:ATP-binding protein n=1 Tax=Zooshikella ganghwensis TaxID=202772 RepID=UPI001BAEDA79|nr:ATP-binding protein [Zooshikella ganghwensis]MBU2704799.1 sensor histidine kinase [Zooshikella ganghwensis]
MKGLTSKVGWLWVLLTWAISLVAFLAWQETVVRQQVLAAFASDMQGELYRFRATLRGILSTYENLPEFLAQQPIVTEFLSNTSQQVESNSINHYLEQSNNVTGAADIYLLDPQGTTIAASNWQRPQSFLGRNFNFRPYFQQAKQGNAGRYFALGTTSLQRGYYFSYPVFQQDKLLGIVVVKVDLANIEQSWQSAFSHGSAQLLVTDSMGVVFISSVKRWLFHSLGKLSDIQQDQLQQEQRYVQRSIPSLVKQVTPVVDKLTPASPALQKIQLVDSISETERHSSYLQHKLNMPKAGWELHIWYDWGEVQRRVNETLLVYGLISWVLLLVGLFIWQRYRTERQLRIARDRLEARVLMRTQDLMKTNQRLKREIEERQYTEAKLRQTQEELIQAAKLAVLGQMSASINHELNQPITAIKGLAENSIVFLEKQQSALVAANLQRINRACERMGYIVAQFKVFARKTPGELTLINLVTAIHSAIDLLKPQLEKQRISVISKLPANGLWIRGDCVWLEQVVVNLLTNAMHELISKTNGVIEVNLANFQDKVKLDVQDNGRGIPAHLLDKVFTPFYTTKSDRQGLGLGLAISQRIIESMGGSIKARNLAQGGAVFSVYLPAIDK